MTHPAAGARIDHRPLPLADLHSGDPVADGRVVIRRLGGGDRYEAWLGWDDHLAAPVVIKVLRAAQADDGRARRAIARESAHLARLELPEDLREALLEAQRIRSHEAKRRQMQYIGRLMREVDAEPIRAQLAAVEGTSAQAAAAHRRLEAWRARLLDDDAALTELVAAHPAADAQQIRALIRNARQEQKLGKPPRASRELFRMLKATLEA